MEKHRYSIGQKVVYEGLIAVIEDRSEYVDGNPCYSLVAVSDKELSCTADERKCEPYNEGDEVDEYPALQEAKNASALITKMGDCLTDKYFRDGNH